VARYGKRWMVGMTYLAVQSDGKSRYKDPEHLDPIYYIHLAVPTHAYMHDTN
jgi:hypothetical protein